ncbi:MAG: hypothetical protein ISR74_04175 [Candidatus Thioglobus sp.]|nr:hypothetical protein [Candidatus Thioglobus sp.]
METNLKKYDVIIIGAGAAGRGNSSHQQVANATLKSKSNITDKQFGRFCLYGS